MHLLAFVVFAQMSVATRPALPVLSFPEPGLDDSAAYLGYQTRLFRDARGNTLQVYLDSRIGRVVHLWADAVNESIAFTARDDRGRPAALRWGAAGAEVGATPGSRWLTHRLVAPSPVVHLGWFLLGSMRVERDFQYAGRQTTPFDDAPFMLPEFERLLASLGRLSAEERQRHLTLLNAASESALRERMGPRITTGRDGANTLTRIIQPAFDGRDSLTLEVRTDPRAVAVVQEGDSVSLRARTGGQVAFTVRVVTSAAALTPLARREIFSPGFLQFLNGVRAAGARAGAPAGDALHARRTERQVRGLELLVSREKLMAGLPTYATYFGRDMLMTALMMRPIWRQEMSEFVIASALRKLSPTGQVSHEEALGGQAMREAASEYAGLLDASLAAATTRAASDSIVQRARDVLRDFRRVRENYHMIDAELQLPIVAARWLADPAVPNARKRAFLLDSSDFGETRLRRLIRELAVVSRMTADYAANPVAANLISFAARDSGRWESQSWRDSRAGYAGGRYAMDVNAIWAPAALESLERILATLRTLGLPAEGIATEESSRVSGTPLARYAREPGVLRSAVGTWRNASRHFVVTLAPAEVRDRVRARLAAMPEPDRIYWSNVFERSAPDRDSLSFLSVALDAGGRPIGVMNSDPATRLFLGDHEGARGAPGATAAAAVLRDVRMFERSYPIGLLVDRVGPVAANDAYGPANVWRDFERDHYHGPRVVWGREVNLFLLGVMNRLADAGSNPPLTTYRQELRTAADRVSAAVQASGFRSELWSYEIRNGRVVAVRYGSGSDVQLWSTTDLVVQYERSRQKK